MRRAFSLAELQITMFLILLVLLMIASIGREYAAISRQSTGKELTLQAATVGLDSVSRDLRCSVAIVDPAGPGGGPGVRTESAPGEPERAEPAL